MAPHVLMTVYQLRAKTILPDGQMAKFAKNVEKVGGYPLVLDKEICNVFALPITIH